MTSIATKATLPIKNVTHLAIAIKLTAKILEIKNFMKKRIKK